VSADNAAGYLVVPHREGVKFGFGRLDGDMYGNPWPSDPPASPPGQSTTGTGWSHRDGGIFTSATLLVLGSMVGGPSMPIVAMAATPSAGKGTGWSPGTAASSPSATTTSSASMVAAGPWKTLYGRMAAPPQRGRVWTGCAEGGPLHLGSPTTSVHGGAKTLGENQARVLDVRPPPAGNGLLDGRMDGGTSPSGTPA